MDDEWMRQKLERFRATAEQSDRLSSRSDYSMQSDLRRQEFAVREILKALEPGREEFDLDAAHFMELHVMSTVDRALGVLEDRAEVAARLAPSAPVLPADQFHPWVWGAARTLWETKHFRQAVQTTWTTINAKLQSKIERRDVSDLKLVQDAFTDHAPAPGRPRLRVLGDPTSETTQSRQRGALQLGQACVSLIRNPATHAEEELAEQIALEQLATLSVFARVVDECQKVTS